jgi:protoheme IX farnesyltransferase
LGADSSQRLEPSVMETTEKQMSGDPSAPPTQAVGRRSGWKLFLRDLVELTKPRIVVMILVTTVATAMIAAGGFVSFGTLAVLLLGTGMVAGSAGGANQIWERVIDRNMPRTAVRPLPSARMSTALATAYTCVMGTLGLAVLWIGFGSAPALVGLATWVLYVFVYTPMKTRTSWNTTVGAIAGALPMLIGYTAMGGSILGVTAWLLFGVLAAWQYPHFMAIAWLYRRQYDEAGFRMSTTVEPTGASAAVQSVLGSLTVIACGVGLCFISPGLFPAVLASVAVLAASLPMLNASLRFAARRDDLTARRLLRSSLLVLPAVLAVVTIRVFW